MADDTSVQVSFGASTDGLEEGVGRAKAAVQGYMASIKDLSGQLEELGESATEAGGKLGAAVSNRDAARMAADNARTQMQLANLVYQDEMEKLKSSLALHEMTEQQKTAATINAINQRLAAQQKALDKDAANAQGNAVVLNRIANQRAVVEAKAANDIEKANDQAALKTAQEWKAAADQVASAFDSQLQKLLAGTEKWSKAMKNIAADLVLKMIEQQVKLTLEYLANEARQLATHVATEGSKTGATTAGAAARSAAETASGETSIFQTIANAIKSIFASAGQTAAAVSADVAPEAGPAAPAIGLAAGGAIASSAMGLVGTASFDVGTDYVLRSGLAMIHQGEQIKPAVGSGPYTGKNDGGGGGGGDTHVGVHISALDSRSIERFFHDNAKHMIRAINNGIKSGAHLGLRGARV
jgi:hypothetical protein